jgi:hypothetical protein
VSRTAVYRRRPTPERRRRFVPTKSTSTLYTGPPAGTGRVEVCGNAVVSFSAPPGNTVAPAVTGTYQRLQTLTTNDGTWTNSPSSYAYQWQRDNSGGGSYSNIASATASTYLLTATDVGCNVRCVVTATNAVGSTSANSNAAKVGDIYTGPPAGTGMVEVRGDATITFDAPANPAGAGGGAVAGFLLIRKRRSRPRLVADKNPLKKP